VSSLWIWKHAAQINALDANRRREIWRLLGWLIEIQWLEKRLEGETCPCRGSPVAFVGAGYFVGELLVNDQVS
jgi:hypothetical protein